MPNAKTYLSNANRGSPLNDLTIDVHSINIISPIMNFISPKIRREEHSNVIFI